MTIITIYALVSVIIVSLISLIGILALSLQERILHKSIFLLVSLAVGALFGDALIHLIPESFEKMGNSGLVSLLILAGILSFFVLEKFLRWRHGHGHSHEENCIQGAPRLDVSPENNTGKIQPLGFLVLISDGLHNLIDGIIIGASYLISIEVGIATTIAIILHEIPQEISDFGILLHAGFTKGRALLVNFLSALLSLVGVGIAFLIAGSSEVFIPGVLAFAAGGFLYIAGSDLVPELHKTSDTKKSLLQFFAMVLGIALMFLLFFLNF